MQEDIENRTVSMAVSGSKLTGRMLKDALSKLLAHRQNPKATSIPSDLYDAAEIDGCNEFSTLIRIVIPLSAPIIAVLGLYYAVAHWNSYFSGLIYLSDSAKYPLQLVLRDFLLSQQSWDDMLTSASAEMQAEIVEQMKKREQLR